MADHRTEGGATRLEHTGSPDAAARERGRLLSLSYRLLGSYAEAEDAVQETYARYYRLDERERRAIGSPAAWLVRVASRVCLDMLKSARRRRERYVGEWLPEPVPGDAASWLGGDVSSDPAERVRLDESVSMALLVVLESMTPAQRVVFVLHDVFRFSFGEVADIVGRSPDACRQLGSAARARVRAWRASHGAPGSREHAAIVRAFKAAWESGDVAGLVALLDPGAIAITDGGGTVSASIEPLLGAESVARFFVAVFERQPDLAIHDATVNGHRGLVARAGSRLVAVISFATRGQRVQEVWAVRNPAKLTAWSRASGPPRQRVVGAREAPPRARADGRLTEGPRPSLRCRRGNP